MPNDNNKDTKQAMELVMKKSEHCMKRCKQTQHSQSWGGDHKDEDGAMLHCIVSFVCFEQGN